MKPYSFATIVIRFIAIYIFIAGLFSGLGPLFLSAAFSTATFGPTQIQMNTPFSGLIGLQLSIAAVSIVVGVLLYIWSRPLGKVIASGLD